jgi:hypothetical protein
VKIVAVVKGNNTNTISQSSAWNRLKRASVIRRKTLCQSQSSLIVARYCAYSLERITDTDTAYSVQDWIARAVGRFMARRYSFAIIKCTLVDRYVMICQLEEKVHCQCKWQWQLRA